MRIYDKLRSEYGNYIVLKLFVALLENCIKTFASLSARFIYLPNALMICNRMYEQSAEATRHIELYCSNAFAHTLDMNDWSFFVPTGGKMSNQ